MADDVDVEIFGQTFRVAAEESTTAYIQSLAAHVDERMRAIADTAKTIAARMRSPECGVMGGFILSIVLKTTAKCRALT